MKKYFDFTLTGKRFLPAWLIYYVFFLVPLYAWRAYFLWRPPAIHPNRWLYVASMAIVLVGGVLSFLITRATIENIKYGEKQVGFNGNIFVYAGKYLLGTFLSMITLSIYTGKFMQNITGYIYDKSSIDSENFKFKGRAEKMWVIFFLALIIPLMLLEKLSMHYLTGMDHTFLFKCFNHFVELIIMIPFCYYSYRWMVDFKFKGYRIKWHTKVLDSCAKILVELLLSVITLGIYAPLALLKLYKYFSEHTIAENYISSLRLGYDLEPKEDFLFIWKQLLLTIVTVGIYFPWAYAKVGKRISNKTYLTEIE
jgi:uncharacterized membrane protein YjgN (DUF898 family)